MLACLFLAPYLCRACGTRFFRFPISVRVEPISSRALAAPPPHLLPAPALPIAAVVIDVPPVVEIPAPVPIPASAVLILADDLPVRKLLRRILERAGYLISELAELAGLGGELNARPVDLVIADLDLPPEETIRLLGPLMTTPDRRVIVLSSDPPAANAVPRSCIVLEKPFRGETLLANVRMVLGAAS